MAHVVGGRPPVGHQVVLVARRAVVGDGFCAAEGVAHQEPKPLGEVPLEPELRLMNAHRRDVGVEQHARAGGNQREAIVRLARVDVEGQREMLAAHVDVVGRHRVVGAELMAGTHRRLVRVRRLSVRAGDAERTAHRFGQREGWQVREKIIWDAGSRSRVIGDLRGDEVRIPGHHAPHRRGVDLVVVNAVAGANHGPALAAQIPGQAQPRRKVIAIVRRRLEVLAPERTRHLADPEIINADRGWNVLTVQVAAPQLEVVAHAEIERQVVDRLPLIVEERRKDVDVARHRRQLAAHLDALREAERQRRRIAGNHRPVLRELEQAVERLIDQAGGRDDVGFESELEGV